MAMTNKPKQAESTKPSAAQIIAELTRARCVFQLEAIRTVMGVQNDASCADISERQEKER